MSGAAKPCCPHSVERHAYNGCATCGCGVPWNEHPDRDLDWSTAAINTRIHQYRNQPTAASLLEGIGERVSPAELERRYLRHLRATGGELHHESTNEPTEHHHDEGTQTMLTIGTLFGINRCSLTFDDLLGCANEPQFIADLKLLLDDPAKRQKLRGAIDQLRTHCRNIQDTDLEVGRGR